MNYEQKYKEALARAKEWMAGKYSHYVSDTPQEISEFIFPELKESSDEKIRKEIIKLVKFLYGSSLACEHTISKDKMLAWLEKQGEQKSQGKSVIKSIKRMVDNAKKVESKDDNSIDLHFSKPTNKVELKFKVGDFIANDYCRGKVVELTDDAYLLDTGQRMLFSYEHNIHLWTINDAKDGDVLVASDNSVFIFTRVNGHACVHYIALASDGTLKINPRLIGAWESVKGVKPATKEQRNLLFQKMKEAGYEWMQIKRS